MHDAAAAVSERLRQTYTEWNNPPSAGLPDGAKVLIDAADEIDRLRASQAGGVPAGWKDISTAPTDTPVLLAAESRNGWAVGEASLLTSNHDDKDPAWWWAATPPGEYHSDDVVNMGAIPKAWMPLPSAPGASPPPPATDGKLSALNAWLDEIEGFSIRRERLPDGALPWVETAWRLGAASVSPATDGDALREALKNLEFGCRQAHEIAVSRGEQHAAGHFDQLLMMIQAALASSPPPVTEIVAPQVVSDATADTGSASAAHLEQILPSPDLGQAAELVKPQCDNPSPAALASSPPLAATESGMGQSNNTALLLLSKVWQLDGDWMKCRSCKAVLIASRDGEPMHHKTGCKHAAHVHPWAELRSALAVPVSATDAVEAERRKFEKARTDIQHLLAIIDFTAEATGEGPDDADAQMVADIRADYGGAAIRARGTDEVENG